MGNSFFRLEACNFGKAELFRRYSCIIPIIQEYLKNVDFPNLLVSFYNNIRILRILSSLEPLPKGTSEVSL